ncbi:hypothetical protein B0H19DRAFT_1079168 [Mycena capillaripes]|nr:hypothetical protein B0H19DRAFT_1079168 [Mycena capillaripes]
MYERSQAKCQMADESELRLPGHVLGRGYLELISEPTQHTGFNFKHYGVHWLGACEPGMSWGGEMDLSVNLVLVAKVSGSVRGMYKEKIIHHDVPSGPENQRRTYIGIASMKFGGSEFDTQVFNRATVVQLGAIVDLELGGLMGLSFASTPITSRLKVTGVDPNIGKPFSFNIFDQSPDKDNSIAISISRTDSLTLVLISLTSLFARRHSASVWH